MTGNRNRNTLIVVTGPTAIGKTELTLKLAQHYDCGIISADSRQIYKRMRIGTAAPTNEQMQLVKHHLTRFLNLTSYYSASLFERDVMNLLPELFSKNNVIVMSGGSGLYIDAVCKGIDDVPDTDPEIREHYIRKYKEEGIKALRDELRLVDPDHYNRVDLRNYRRIIRALEVFATTGSPYSSFLGKEKKPRDFNIIKIALYRDRDELYLRINQRVDTMIKQGLIGEARTLYPMRNLNSLQTVGYRELFLWFDGELNREEAIELIKTNTRRYAKRQITWWNKDQSVKWFSPDNLGEIINFVESQLNQ